MRARVIGALRGELAPTTRAPRRSCRWPPRRARTPRARLAARRGAREAAHPDHRFVQLLAGDPAAGRLARRRRAQRQRGRRRALPARRAATLPRPMRDPALAAGRAAAVRAARQPLAESRAAASRRCSSSAATGCVHRRPGIRVAVPQREPEPRGAEARARSGHCVRVPRSAARAGPRAAGRGRARPEPADLGTGSTSPISCSPRTTGASSLRPPSASRVYRAGGAPRLRDLIDDCESCPERVRRCSAAARAAAELPAADAAALAALARVLARAAARAARGIRRSRARRLHLVTGAARQALAEARRADRARAARGTRAPAYAGR